MVGGGGKDKIKVPVLDEAALLNQPTKIHSNDKDNGKDNCKDNGKDNDKDNGKNNENDKYFVANRPTFTALGKSRFCDFEDGAILGLVAPTQFTSSQHSQSKQTISAKLLSCPSSLT